MKKLIEFNITKHETGIDLDYFNKHPKSHKKVYRICDECGKGSWIRYSNNKLSLCHSCSLKDRKLSNEHKANISKGIKK